MPKAHDRSSSKLDVELLVACFDALPMPCFVEDAEGRIVRANAAFWALLPDATPREVTFRELFSGSDSPGVPSTLPPREQPDGRVRLRLRDGRELAGQGVALGAPSAAGARLYAFSDVTEFARQTAAIEARDAFLARMSHDLRSPLGVVLGAAQLLAAGDATAEQRESLEAIFNAGRLLLQLIDDVLDYGKLRAGRFVLTPRVVDLWALVEEAASTLRTAAEAKGLGFEHKVHPEVPRWVRVDPVRLRQVVMNLGTNAVKYTESGAVSLHVERELGPGRALLLFSVADTGPGIDTEQLPALFDAYVQGAGNAERGTGLGLAITRELVELMGGSVRAQSTPGVGSTFSFTLEVELGRPSHVLRASRIPSREHGESAPTRARILIAEDNVFTQVILRKTVERLGHSVVVANNGLEVIDRVEAEDFDAVMMDCQMPLLDGYSTTARLRELGYGADDLPIIALTANALPDDREKCLVAGMNDYLAKPFTLAEVGAALERWLSLRSPPAGASIAPPSSPLANAGFDSKRLHDLSGGDAGVVADVCRIFLDDMTARLGELERARDRSDVPALRRVAHQVAGSASNVGAKELELIARDLEHGRVQGAGVGEAIRGLERELGRVRRAMTELTKGSE